MKKICAITMVRNDNFFLNRWIAYYGRQLGEENLYIFLDGKDQITPANAINTNIKKIEHLEGPVAIADRKRIRFLSVEAAKLFERYDLVIGTDVDEFLLVDPKCNKSLSEYLSEIDIQISVSGLGIDVGQKINVEKNIVENQPFLLQRNFAVLSSRYTKASVIAKPIQWGAGFHRVKGHNFKIDKNLYLFHFGCVDSGILKQKFGDNDKLKNGWERHLNKRSRTITLISTKRAKNGDEIIPFARLLQTIIRPIFAWNKPSMAGLKLVIRIPERFKGIC
ncbi:MAG: glycosyltransferase family 2 protein [Paludibacter sp.]|nr:glycosyltransferase family 2 protein [Paludibacter sp.]